jgi:hypothetical protein
MAKRRMKKLHAKDALEFFNQVMVEQPLLPFLVPLTLFAWFVERWVVPFSNWVPLAAAVWATIQYGRFKRNMAIEDLNKRWKHLILNTTVCSVHLLNLRSSLFTDIQPYSVFTSVVAYHTD